MFEPVISDLSASHHLIVPDLRGHGRSRHLPQPYTIAKLAEDLAGLMDALGISSADVIGYSNGGTVAQQLVLDHPARCRRLVLACTYAYNMASPSEWVEGHLGSPLIHALGMKRFAEFMVSRVKKELGEDRAAWVAEMLAQQDTGLMAIAWKEAMTFDSRPRLGEIRCPTLVIAASHDQALPMHHATMLHEGIAGSRLAVIEGDHTLLWTRTAEFLRVVEEFLSPAV
jgi:3-oxoadipate enol-lactonase